MTQELLIKYMRHVRQCEGSTFVDYLDDVVYQSEVTFTEAEKVALRSINVVISKAPWAEHPADIAGLLISDTDPAKLKEMRAIFDETVDSSTTCTEVHLIVTKTSKTFGHGSFGTALEIAMRGPYGEDGPSPAFLNKPAAEAYAADPANGYRLEVLTLSVVE